jgi:hypothetical protein
MPPTNHKKVLAKPPIKKGTCQTSDLTFVNNRHPHVHIFVVLLYRIQIISSQLLSLVSLESPRAGAGLLSSSRLSRIMMLLYNVMASEESV